MNKADVIELFQYNEWAKERLLESLESMKAEDFQKDLHSSHGGVRSTLYHMVNAEHIWISRLNGISISNIPDSKMSSLADIKHKWNELDDGLSRYLSTLSDERLKSEFVYHDSKGNKYSHPLVWTFAHLFNHFSYHRGQIVAFQRQMGYTPANTDLIRFYRERMGR